MTNKTFSAFPFNVSSHQTPIPFPVITKLNKTEIEALKQKKEQDNGEILSAFDFVSNGLENQEIFTLLSPANAVLFQKMYLTSMPIKHLFSRDFVDSEATDIFSQEFLSEMRNTILNSRSLFTGLEEITNISARKKRDVDSKIERISSIIIETDVQDFI